MIIPCPIKFFKNFSDFSDFFLHLSIPLEKYVVSISGKNAANILGDMQNGSLQYNYLLKLGDAKRAVLLGFSGATQILSLATLFWKKDISLNGPLKV